MLRVACFYLNTQHNSATKVYHPLVLARKLKLLLVIENVRNDHIKLETKYRSFGVVQRNFKNTFVQNIANADKLIDDVQQSRIKLIYIVQIQMWFSNVSHSYEILPHRYALRKLGVISHSTNERSHWIKDNISNPNLDNSILLKSVSYCYFYCWNDQWNISFAESSLTESLAFTSV